MAKIIRLTESDLHNIIRNTVKRVIGENTTNPYLSAIDDYVYSLSNDRNMEFYPNEDNEIEFDLENGCQGTIQFYVESNAYVEPGWKSNDYDQPDDPDEIVDEPKVTEVNIYLYSPEGKEIPVQDDGTLMQTLQGLIDQFGLEYGQLPTSDEFHEEDPDAYYDDPDSPYWRNR